jgi:hypothetical protein
VRTRYYQDIELLPGHRVQQVLGNLLV